MNNTNNFNKYEIIKAYRKQFEDCGYRQLSGSEFMNYFSIYKAGGPDADEAKEMIVYSMYGAIITVANSVCADANKLEDCFQIGFMRLCEMLDKFNPERGDFFRFSNFHTRLAMTSFLESDKDIPITSESIRKQASIVRQAKTFLESQGIFNPTTEEISENSGLDIKTVNKILKINNQCHAKHYEDNDFHENEEYFVDDHSFVDDLYDKYLKADILKALRDYRNPKHVEQFLLRIGVNSPEMSCEEIANLEEYSCSRQAVDKNIRKVVNFICERCKNWRAN